MCFWYLCQKCCRSTVYSDFSTFCTYLQCVIDWVHISDLAIVDAWALTWINLSNYYIISLMYLWAEGLPHWILWAYASFTHVLSLSLMCGTLNIILLRTILIFRPVHVSYILIISQFYPSLIRMKFSKKFCKNPNKIFSMVRNKCRANFINLNLKKKTVSPRFMVKMNTVIKSHSAQIFKSGQ